MELEGSFTEGVESRAWKHSKCPVTEDGYFRHIHSRAQPARTEHKQDEIHRTDTQAHETREAQGWGSAGLSPPEQFLLLS